MSLHVHFLDPYKSGSSLVHRLDPRVKLVLVVAFILANSLVPMGAWAIYFLLLTISLSGAVLSELGIGFILKRAFLALPFVLAALPLLFTLPGPALLTVGSLQISLPGLERFGSIAIKSWISVQAAILLAATTQFPDLLHAMRSLHLPRLLVAIIGLMWRYIFVIGDEALRMLRARSARSGVSDDPTLRPGGSLGWRARVTGAMAGSLFLRSLERSDRIYAAMAARGYDGEIRSFPLSALSTRNWITLVAGLSILLMLVLLGVFLWR
jgi:cobalt/nickel transport system permease protein